MVLFTYLRRAISLLFIFAAYTASGQKADLPVYEFQKNMQSADAQILDVRTQAEYNSGHLPHALLSDWSKPEIFKERVKSLDKDKPVYTYCLSGGRSTAASEWLIQEGFKQVYNMDGGMMAWKSAQLPVEGVPVAKAITTTEYFSKIPADKTVLVDIGAVWCPPCRKMEPVINEIRKEKDADVVVIGIDGGVQEQLAASLNVTAFPTFIVYKKGREAWRQTGIVTKEILLQQLH